MENFSDLDLSKTYTYLDYFGWRFSERVELLKGKVFKKPSTFSVQQILVGEFHGRLWESLKGNPCRLF